jgi:hypothetical protein
MVRLLSPEPVGWLEHHQLYSSAGADIVMESIRSAMVVAGPLVVIDYLVVVPDVIVASVWKKSNSQANKPPKTRKVAQNSQARETPERP